MHNIILYLDEKHVLLKPLRLIWKAIMLNVLKNSAVKN